MPSQPLRRAGGGYRWPVAAGAPDPVCKWPSPPLLIYNRKIAYKSDEAWGLHRTSILGQCETRLYGSASEASRFVMDITKRQELFEARIVTKNYDCPDTRFIRLSHPDTTTVIHIIHPDGSLLCPHDELEPAIPYDDHHDIPLDVLCKKCRKFPCCEEHAIRPPKIHHPKAQPETLYISERVDAIIKESFRYHHRSQAAQISNNRKASKTRQKII